MSKVRFRLRAISEHNADIFDVGFQLGSDISAYCSEIRSTKQPLQIGTLSSIAQEIAAVELGKQSPRPLDEINALLVQLATDVGTTLATAMDSEHVVQRMSFRGRAEHLGS